MALTTDQLLKELHELKHDADLEKWLASTSSSVVTLHAYLDFLLKKSGFKRAQVCRDAHVDATFGYQIFQGTRGASRNTLLRLALALHITLYETNVMLRLGGCNALYCKEKFDAIVIFGLDHQRSVPDVNDMLYDHNLPLLEAQPRFLAVKGYAMSASMSDIDRYLQSLETEDAYRFVRTIKTSEFEVTQLVTRSFASKSEERAFYAPYTYYLDQGKHIQFVHAGQQASSKHSNKRTSQDSRNEDFKKAHEQGAKVAHDRSFSNRFVRKLIMRESPLGDVYEKLFSAQHNQEHCAYTPHLPFIFECYRNDSHRVVIMQVIDGPNLEQFMRALPFEVRIQQAQKLLPSLCEAARELHEFSDHPIIHRDISPDNIIVCHDAAFLIDFGVAREYKENATHDTVCFGTRIYAAPEQFGYQQSSIRSDVYGLGMVLAYMLKGSDISAVDVSMNFECLDSLFARAHKRDMGKRLISVIAKAVAFDPKVRFGSPHEFLHAFQDACSGAVGSAVALDGVTSCVGDGAPVGFSEDAPNSADGIGVAASDRSVGDGAFGGVAEAEGGMCTRSTSRSGVETDACTGSSNTLSANILGMNTSNAHDFNANHPSNDVLNISTNTLNPNATSVDTSTITTAPTCSDASTAHGPWHWFDHPYKAVRVVCMLWNVCVFLTWGLFSWAAICSGTISYLSTDTQREVFNRVFLAGMLPLCFTIWGACLMFKPRWFYAFRLFRGWRWWWNGIVAFLAFVALVTYAIIGYHAQ